MSAAGAGMAKRETNAEIRARGERHVAAELGRRGIEHRMERMGRRNDFSIRRGDDVVTLQVRVTSKGQYRGWLVQDSLERNMERVLVYAFVDTKPPVLETFIIPGEVVSDVLRASHGAWLATPGREGRMHEDSPMRMIRRDYGLPVPGYPPGWLEEYRERWDLVANPSRR